MTGTSRALELRGQPGPAVGLVGFGGSGKDTVAEMLVERGFVHVSASDMVRQEIENRGLRSNRELQTSVANEMRRLHGAAHFVRAAYELGSAREGRPVALTGIYAEAEARYVLEELKGALVRIETAERPDDLYARVRERSDGDRDDLTLEEYRVARSRESSGLRPDEANVLRCMELATHALQNVGSLQDLRCQVEALLTRLLEGSLWAKT
jgi:predicted kinase